MSHRPVPNSAPIPWWFLLIPLAQAVLLAVTAQTSGVGWLVFGGFIAISTLASWRLFADSRHYSLNKAWWLFALIFLSIIPSIQLASGMMPWSTGEISQAVMLKANGLILLCLGLYEGVRLWASRNFIPQPEQSPPPVSPVLVRQFAHLAPGMVLSCGAALIIVYGYKALFSLPHLEHSLTGYSSSFRLVFDNLLRGTMLWCCISAIVLYRQHKLGIASLLLVLVPGLVFNFPLSLPGFITLCVFLSWGLAAGLKIFSRQHGFSLLIAGLFLIVAPLYNIARLSNSEPVRPAIPAGVVLKRALLISDNDAWSTVCRTLSYNSLNGSTNGRQLIGVSLFFVPRIVWPNKPVGSGALLYKQRDPGYPNTACTYLAEGYINFGLPGSLVLTALIALLIARYDGWYWRRGGRVRFTLARLFYFVCIGLLFFILRGDLMASFAWLVGFCFIFTFWQGLFFWRRKRSERELDQL